MGDIGIRFDAEGYGEFKKALKDTQSNLKVLGSELKATKSEFDKNDKSVESLTAQNKTLKKVIDEQKKAVADLAKGVDAATAEWGENDKRTQDLVVQYNKAKTALNNLEREYEQNERAIKGLGDETKDLGDDFDKTGQKSIKFGDLLKANLASDVIMSGVRAITNAVVELGREFIQFASEGVALASNLQEVQNVVDTTFGNSANQVDKFAKSAATAYGLSELSAKQYSGTMGAMLKSMGMTDEAVLQMSTDMTGLAGDIASFYNLDSDEAFAKIRSGISGETEPLKQLGINMSIANLEAYALSEGITQSYKSMSQAEQATLRYNYLMSVTADAQGDFAKTADSYANQQRILELNIENLKAGLGEKLLPTLTEVTSAFNDLLSGEMSLEEFVQKLVGTLTSKLPELIKSAGTIIKGIGEGLIKALPELLPVIIDVVKSLGMFLVKSLPMLVEAAAEIIIAIANGIADSLPELIPTIVDVVLQIVDTLIEHSDEMMDASIEIILALADGLIEALPKLIEKAPEIIIKLAAGLIENLPKIFEVGITLIGKLLEGIASVFLSLWEIGKEIIAAIGEGISEVWDSVYEWGKNIIDNLLQGLKDAWPSIVGWLASVVSPALGNLVNEINNVKTSAPRGGNNRGGVDGSFATGLDYVPFDGFIAELHKGEMVVPASAANVMRGSSNTVNHTGTIRVEGVNNSGDLVAVADMIIDQMRREVRMA